MVISYYLLSINQKVASIYNSEHSEKKPYLIPKMSPYISKFYTEYVKKRLLVQS